MTTPMTPSTNKPTAKPDQAGAPEHQARMRPDRTVQAQALADVQALLQGLPLRRDLLIEHLHRINDAHGHLRTDHLAALAQLLRLSQAQVLRSPLFITTLKWCAKTAAAVLTPRPQCVCGCATA